MIFLFFLWVKQGTATLSGYSNCSCCKNWFNLLKSDAQSYTKSNLCCSLTGELHLHETNRLLMRNNQIRGCYLMQTAIEAEDRCSLVVHTCREIPSFLRYHCKLTDITSCSAGLFSFLPPKISPFPIIALWNVGFGLNGPSSLQWTEPSLHFKISMGIPWLLKC